MSKVALIIDEPETCSECPFVSSPIYVSSNVKINCYKKISKCLYAPDDIEDPWRNISWQRENRESWCPLVHFGEED